MIVFFEPKPLTLTHVTNILITEIRIWDQCYPITFLLMLVKNSPLGGVSLTFHKLSKIIAWKYTVPEITFMVRISNSNFVCVPKAWLWAHIQSFSLKFSSEVRFLQFTNVERIFLRAHTPLVKHTHVIPTADQITQCLKKYVSSYFNDDYCYGSWKKGW